MLRTLLLHIWCVMALQGTRAHPPPQLISDFRMLVPHIYADLPDDSDATSSYGLNHPDSDVKDYSPQYRLSNDVTDQGPRPLYHRESKMQDIHKHTGKVYVGDRWLKVNLFGLGEQKPISFDDNLHIINEASYDDTFSDIPSSEFTLDSSEIKPFSSDIKPYSTEIDPYSNEITPYTSELKSYSSELIDSSEHRPVVKKDLSKSGLCNNPHVHSGLCRALQRLLAEMTSSRSGMVSSRPSKPVDSKVSGTVPVVALLSRPVSSRRSWRVLNEKHPDNNMRQYVLLDKNGSLVV